MCYIHVTPVHIQSECSTLQRKHAAQITPAHERDTVEIRAVEEVCQDAVSSLAYKEKPIRLQLSTAHVQAMQTQCHEWQRTGMTPFADATILLKNPDADGTPEWKQVRVHAVLFAASCEYLRGQPV
jgi:hypothetical protein